MAKSNREYWLSDDGLLLIRAWARDGLDNAQIAKNCAVSVSTFYEWKSKYSELSEALKRGKEVVDYEVENALYKKCVGYYVPKDVTYKLRRVYYDDKDRRCEDEKIETVTVEEYIPPDTTAIAIWLNNRKPEKWRRNANKERLDDEKFSHEKAVDDRHNW